jgi:hypothetical protein
VPTYKFRLSIESDEAVTVAQLAEALSPRWPGITALAAKNWKMPQNKVRPLTAERLLAHRRIDPETGCWLWTGTLSQQGYGRLVSNYREYPASRAAAIVWLGFDPDSELWVLHKCDNPPCFNPDHLWIGTPKENTRDMMAKGRDRFLFSRRVADAV